MEANPKNNKLYSTKKISLLSLFNTAVYKSLNTANFFI